MKRRIRNRYIDNLDKDELEKERLRCEIKTMSSWGRWVPIIAPVATAAITGLILYLSNFFQASAIQLQNRKDSLNYAIQQHQSQLDSIKKADSLIKDKILVMEDSVAIVTQRYDLMTTNYNQTNKEYKLNLVLLKNIRDTIKVLGKSLVTFKCKPSIGKKTITMDLRDSLKTSDC